MGWREWAKSAGLVAGGDEKPPTDEEFEKIMAGGGDDPPEEDVPASAKKGRPTGPGAQRGSQPGAPPPPPLNMPSQGSAGPRTFAEIYQLGGVKPPAHGFTVDRLYELLQMPHMAPLERSARNAAVMAVLGMQKIPAEDIVKDAAERAVVLGDYETWLSEQGQKQDAAAEAEAQRLEAELATVTEEIRGRVAAIRKAPAIRAQSLASWRAEKATELARLHEAASVVLPPGASNPVTLPEPPKVDNPFMGPGAPSPFGRPFGG